MDEVAAVVHGQVVVDNHQVVIPCCLFFFNSSRKYGARFQALGFKMLTRAPPCVEEKMKELEMDAEPIPVEEDDSTVVRAVQA